MHASIPKFTSFRAKPAAISPDQTSTHSNPIVENDRKQNQARRDAHEAAQERNDGRRRAHAHERRGAGQDLKGDKSKSPSEEEVEESLFVVDRKGDRGIREYGTNSSRLVPEHRIPTNKRLLGGQLANLQQHSSKRGVLSNLSRNASLALQTDGQYVGTGGEDVQNADDLAAKDYLPLGVNITQKHSLKRRSNHDLREFANEGLTTGSGLSSESESSDSDTLGHYGKRTRHERSLDIRKENERLLRLVKSEPHHVLGWLALIEFQDRWVLQNRGEEDAGLGRAEQRSVAEVRIALYEEALEKVSDDNDGREPLLLGLLREGEKVWGKSKLVGKWRDITANNRGCLDLQLEYVNFIQTNFSVFSYGSCRDQYAEYLQILSQNTKLSVDNRAVREIYALLRLAAFMRDAGFTELSRSLWQSLLEMSCLTPDWARNTYTGMMNSYEKYWDDEYHRVGEERWQGWYHSQDISPPTPLTKIPELEPSGQTTSNDLISAWLVSEKSSESRALWPGRTTDEYNEEGDPYRVVFFADLKPFLIEIRPEHRRLLINAFLCYHQLPSLPSSQSCPSRLWWQDSFLRSCIVSERRNVSHIDMVNVITSIETLFDESQKFCTSQATQDNSTKDLSTEKFISRVLDALTKAIPEDGALAEYYIAFVSAHDPLRARKAAKAMLKRNSSNLTIYNAYGLLESRLGNEEEANRVFSTAIRVGESIGAAEQLNIVLLHRTWIWQALKLDNIPLALQRLQSIAPTPEAITAALSRFRDTAIEQSLQSMAALASEVLSLHSYLTASSDNLAAALESFSAESKILVSKTPDASYAVELLHQAQAQLIEYHVRHKKSYSPKHVRDALRSSIVSFPNNTMLLSAYAENERRFRIDDRVRQLTKDLLLADNRDTVVAWHFAIKTEMERSSGELSGTTVHSVRATFQKAIVSRGAKDSASLWAAYFMWEVEIARMEGVKTEAKGYERARQVWLRGLNALPWVKRFVEMGIEQLKDCMTFEECKGFVGLMAARGLRLHHDLDDLS